MNQDVDGSYVGGRDSFYNYTLNNEDAAFTINKSIKLEEETNDVVGAGTLGDIMAGSALSDTCEATDISDTNACQSTISDGLVTKEGGELNSSFGCYFSPMERIALTANGNLQRIFSSYYDAPIHVHVDSCARRDKKSVNSHNISNLEKFSLRIESDGAIWDRVVHLHVYEQVSLMDYSSFPTLLLYNNSDLCSQKDIMYSYIYHTCSIARMYRSD